MLLVITFSISLDIHRASGHAGYERSEPAADAVLPVAPAQVRIWFTQELFRRQGMNKIEVVDAGGQRVDLGDGTIDDDDRKLMWITLAPDLPDGRYTVRWQSLSAEDGHEGKGEFTFTVTANVSSTSTASETVSQTVVTSTPISEPVVTVSPTAAPSSAVVSTPAPNSAPALPCLGGATPLLLVIGGILTHRRLYRRF
jgi:methionine-rich copper-binding protein CopC